MLHIKVVGSGCPTCQNLERLCKEVTDEENIATNIEKITDFDQFADLGVFLTPGLIVNDELVSSGKLPDKTTLKKWLTDRAAQN